jgi:GntR family transcriptional regulator, transcriptional repressor for pyruvate dehydrogenase complex
MTSDAAGPVGSGDLGGAVLGSAVLASNRGRHAFEDCVERLATAIRLGAYPDGSVLPPERELAVTMGVSRATLREAMAGLRSAGMVKTTRGRGGGTVVVHAPPSPGVGDSSGLAGRRDELMDALVFRRIVEPGACELAASRTLRHEQRGFLVEALTAVESATDVAAHRQADSRLHLAIASITESPSIINAVTSVQADLHDMLIAIPVLPVNIEHSGAQHRVIVDAILGNDRRRARGTMASHCDDTAALLRGLLT